MSMSVDERVVAMRFDNQQFERNIRSTMSTLDKLKQSLRFDGASKGLQNLDKAANDISFDGIAAGVAALEKRFSTFGIVGMRVIQNLTDSAMRFTRNTLGFMTDGIVNGGKRRAMNIENAHFQLQGLLKDEEKVQAVMDDAMNSVDGTAYAYDEAAKAASQFAASGMEAGEKMQASLRAITGVAAMTNSEYESISQIFTTVSGNGRLMGDQLLQLSSRGLNAAATLADYMTKVGNGAKVTEGEVRDMVSKGEISFELFAAAMDDAFGEHAKKANETFTGAMSNVKASLARIGAEFISPLIVQNGPLVEFFNALREKINDVKANIGPLAKLFTDSVSGMAKSATKYLQDLDLTKSFEAFYNVVDVFKNVVRSLSSIWMPIRWAFEDIFPQSMINSIINFTSKLKEFSSGLKLNHVDAVNLRNTFKGLFAVLDIASRIIGGVVQAIFPMTKSVSGFGSAVLTVTGNIGKWLTALDNMIKESSTFGKIVKTIGNVVGFVFQSIGDRVKSVTDAFWDFVRNDFGAAAKARLSPFQKICEIAKLAMDKLALTFQEVAPVLAKFGEMIVNTLGQIGNGLQKAIHGEGFNSLIDLLNGGLMAGIGVEIMNFIGYIQKSVVKANGMFANANLILSNVKNTLISYQASLKADVLMKIAKAIAVLSGSLFVLALIDSEKLSGALAALTVLVVELSATMAVFGKTLSGKGIISITCAGTMIMAFSTAILILSAALKVISGIDSDKLTGALLGITVLLGELTASSIILSKWGGKVKTSAAGMVLFAAAIYILAEAVNRIAKLDTGKLAKGLIGVGVLLAELSAFMAAAKFGNFKASTGLGMIELAAALLILEKVVSGFGGMKTESLVKGLTGVAGALLAVAAATFIMPKNMVAIGVGLIAVSAALKIIGGVIRETGKMGWEAIGKGLAVLAGSMIILSVALNAMKGTIGGAAAMLIMSAALSVFTPCLKSLGKMSLPEIGKAILALASAFVILGIAGAVLAPIIPAILGLSAALALLGVGVAACGAGILALSVGLASLAVSGVAGMTAFVAGLEILFVGILDIIARSAESIANAVKTVVLAVVSVVVECAPAIVEGVLTLIEEVLKSLAVHIPAIVNYLIDFFIGVMNALAERMPELIQAAVNLISSFFCSVIKVLKGMDTTALVEMIAGIGLFAALMYALSAVAGLVPSAMAGVLGMGIVMAELAAVLAVIGGLAQIPGLEWFIHEGGDLLQEIGIAIGKFVGGIVGGLLSGVSSVLPQIGADLSSFMANAAPFFMGLSMITADTLAKAGFLAGIILLFGAADLLSGITNFLTGGSRLPEAGIHLSQFMVNAMPFFSGLMIVNDSALNAAKNLAEMILLFTVSDLIQGITSWLTGESSLADFGEELAEFGPSIAEFAEEVKDVKPQAVEGAAAAAKIMSEVADNLPGKGGLKQKIFGEKSLLDFALQLVAFGPSIALFSEIVKDVKPEAVEGAASAANIMSAVADNLPEQGGLKQKIFGQKNISAFGAELVLFGGYVADFADKVKDVKPEAVEGAESAANIMSAVAEGLPESNGWLSAITGGQMSLSEFGEELVDFASSIVDFADKVKDVKPEAVEGAESATNIMSAVAEGLPESNGWLSAITGGQMSLSEFGEELADFAPGIADFADKVKDVKPEAVEGAAAAANIMAAVAEGLPESDSWLKKITGGTYSLSDFGEELADFGPYISDYYEAVNKIDNPQVIDSSAKAIKTLIEIAKAVTDTSNLTTFGNDLKAFGELLAEYYSSVSSIDANKLGSITDGVKKLANLATSEMLKGFSEGVSSNQTNIDHAFKTATAVGLNAIQNECKKFKTKGNDVVKKFAKGVSDKAGDVKAPAEGVAKKALTAINSKQEAFYLAGSKAVDQFVDGIEKNAYKADNAIQDMINNAQNQSGGSTGGQASEASSVGGDFVDNFVGGIKEKLPSANSAGQEVGQEAAAGAAGALGIQSPSKEFHEIGGYVVDGFTNGIDDNKDKAAKSAENLAKVGIETAKAVLESLKDSNSVFSEFVENTDENGDAIEVTLEQAAEAFLSFRDSVKDSIKDATGVFDAFEVEMDVTGKQLIKNLKSQITGITEWAANMQLLAARGVNQGLLKALSDMGPSGAKYVSALVTMSGKELKKMNKLYQQRLSLNDKSADEIAASFVEGGKKSADAYKNGFLEVSKKTKNKLKESNRASLNEMVTKDISFLGFTFKEAVANVKSSLDYGKGAFQQFCNEYLTGTKNIAAGNAAIKAASSAITAYGKKIYEESEYYKEDTKNLKDHTKSLKDLEKDGKRLQKQLKKAQKSNKKNSKERVKTLEKELESNEKAITSAKKQIEKDQKEIAKHTKEVFKNLRSDLSDSVSAFLDPLKVSLDSGVDLFKKFESNSTLYEEDKKRLAEHQKELAAFEKQRENLQNELNEYAKSNALESKLQVERIKKELEEVEKNIEDAKNNIKQDEDDMASHSEITVDKILENMQSQITGVKQWKKNLQKLAGKGVSEGLLAYLKNMGVDGVDYVDQFMKMTSDEINKANALFKESENLSAQSLLDGFKEQMKTANNFASGLEQMAKMGFKQDLLEKLGDMGPDGYEYVKAFLTMTPQQVAEFNQEFANSLTLPNSIADKMIASFAYAGGQSVAGFTEALAKLTQTGTEENTKLVTTAQNTSKVFENVMVRDSKIAGERTIRGLSDGLLSEKETAKKNSSSVGKEILKPMKKVFSKKSGDKLGGNIVNGMKKGLSDGSSSVSRTAENVALKAYKSAKNALGIKSPSKMFAKLGRYTDAGFIEGLKSGEKDVSQTAMDVMGQAIQEVSDILNSDMDTEPMIRPVMDLADIQNGVRSIDKLLSGCTVSTSAELAGIAAGSMQGKGAAMEEQTLSAINQLQKTLSNLLDKPNVEQHNNFSITGNDPREIANEVSYILQKQVERRSATWA